MTGVRAICVFCGSSPGDLPDYAEAARSFGEAIAQRGWDLVYGGAAVGLMEVVADTVLAGGGRVTGIITESLVGHEIAHLGLTRLDVVSTMHERKAAMASLADAFVMLPGGVGTCEEFFEAVTWSQLGIHSKPCGILDVRSYFGDLLAFLEHARRSGFIRPEGLGDLVVHREPEGLLDALWAADVPSRVGERDSTSSYRCWRAGRS